MIIEVANDNSTPSFVRRVVALISVMPTPPGKSDTPPNNIAA